MYSPSLCIFSLLCLLLLRFPLMQVSVVHFPQQSFTLFWAYHLSFMLNLTPLPPLQLHPVGLTASPFLLHPLNPLHPFFSSFLFISVFTLCIPLLLLLPLCSTPLADSFVGCSVKTALEATIDARNYDDGCACFVCLL